MVRRSDHKWPKKGWKRGRPVKDRLLKVSRPDGTSKNDRVKSFSNYIMIFIALMIGVEGLDLTVTANKLVSVYPFMWGVGLLMVIGGFSWALYVLRPELFLGEEVDRGPTATVIKDKEDIKVRSMAERLLAKLTLQGRLIKAFPVFGIVLFVIDLAYNWYFYGSIDYDQLGTHDIVALLFAGVLMAYPYIPKGWEKERDFAFFFAVGLIMFLVIPLLMIRFESSSQEGAVDQYAAWLLARPLSGTLMALGIQARASGIYIEFAVSDGTLATLGITTSCSGIYSFTIFSAAFISFVMVEYRRLQLRVLGLMGLGILTAYFANLLRMLMITLVGHWYDTKDTGLEYTLWAHANAGWLIFLIWIALFWWLMFKYVMKGEFSDTGFEPIDLDEDVFCSRCGIQIDNKEIPKRCPECGQKFEFEEE